VAQVIYLLAMFALVLICGLPFFLEWLEGRDDEK
jgi:hypothetical protein